MKSYNNGMHVCIIRLEEQYLEKERFDRVLANRKGCLEDIKCGLKAYILISYMYVRTRMKYVF